MHVSGKTRVVLVILLIVLGLLLINRRHVKRRPPIASISSMEDKRREWSANYAATLGPPLPMHKVRSGSDNDTLLMYFNRAR